MSVDRDTQLRKPQLEAAILSILVAFPPALDDVTDLLPIDVFTIDHHRSIYAEICKQYAAGEQFTSLSIAKALENEIDITVSMEIFSTHDWSSRGIKRYAQEVNDAYLARQLHAVSYKLAELAYEDGPVSDRIDRAQAEVSKLETRAADDDWVDAETAAVKHLDLLEEREAGRVKGMETGLADLDELLDGGLVRGNLVVIGARPSMGKTAMGMSIGLHMAATYAVGMFSMEMPHNDVRDRQAAILGRVSIGHIKRPSKGLDYTRIVDGVERSKGLRWNVSDRSNLNIMQVRAMARGLKRRRGLDVLIVDYIGLMPGVESKQPRAYQIEEISRGLKSLAKELDIVVICLAQVNRGAAEKVNSPPSLHELRDSGAIEQDADVVGFIHRMIKANPNAGAQYENHALLRIAKNRQGRTGDVDLFYHGEFTGFESWAGPPPKAIVDTAHRGRRGMDQD